MNIIKLLLLLGAVGFAYQLWQKHQASSELAALARSASPNGFVELPRPANSAPTRILLFAPENCSSEEARRADDLAWRLTNRGIPFARSESANFEFAEPDPTLLRRVGLVMKGEVPIVFVGDRAKANPTFEEVISEYEATR